MESDFVGQLQVFRCVSVHRIRARPAVNFTHRASSQNDRTTDPTETQRRLDSQLGCRMKESQPGELLNCEYIPHNHRSAVLKKDISNNIYRISEKEKISKSFKIPRSAKVQSKIQTKLRVDLR